MEEVSPLYQAEGLCARHSVSTLEDFPFHSHVSTFLIVVFENVSRPQTCEGACTGGTL